MPKRDTDVSSGQSTHKDPGNSESRVEEKGLEYAIDFRIEL